MIDSLQVSDDLTQLEVTWAEGGATLLAAQMLRQEARDAGSIRRRLDFGGFSAAPDLQIIALTQVGPAGVNIHFSDGHDRAVYPFVYLKELSDLFDN